jgi:hypothetical protein
MTVIIDDRTSAGIDFRAVRVYDESKVVSVLAGDYEVLDLDELRALAERLFAQLP